MTAWSAGEIHAAVQSILPEGWMLSVSRTPPFRATVRDASGTQLWLNESFDERMLLLDAYGWLLLREHQRSEDGPWAPRRRELTRCVAQPDAEAFADPPDLDPAELAAVYLRTSSEDEEDADEES